VSDDTLSGQLTQRTTWARESRDCYLSMTPQELARLAGMARRLEADLAAARAEVEALRARKPSLPDKLERRLCEVAEGDDESPEGYRIAVQVARDLLAALDAPAPGEPDAVGGAGVPALGYDGVVAGGILPRRAKQGLAGVGRHRQFEADSALHGSSYGSLSHAREDVNGNVLPPLVETRGFRAEVSL